jgi:hypothetical protein
VNQEINALRKLDQVVRRLRISGHDDRVGDSQRGSLAPA